MANGIYELYYAEAPNGMGYVGCTKHTVEQRWKGHQPFAHCDGRLVYIEDAIGVFGRDAFTVTHVANALNAHDAAEAETLLIAQYGTLKPNGFNRSARSNIARFTKERPKPVKTKRDWLYVNPRKRVAWPPRIGAPTSHHEGF